MFSWVVLVVSIVAWPVTALTVFSDEPRGILGLSWAAIIWTAYGNVATAQVNKEVSVQADTTNVSADEVHVNQEDG